MIVKILKTLITISNILKKLPFIGYNPEKRLDTMKEASRKFAEDVRKMKAQEERLSTASLWIEKKKTDLNDSIDEYESQLDFLSEAVDLARSGEFSNTDL